MGCSVFQLDPFHSRFPPETRSICCSLLLRSKWRPAYVRKTVTEQFPTCPPANGFPIPTDVTPLSSPTDTNTSNQPRSYTLKTHPKA